MSDLAKRLNELCERHQGVRLTTPFVLWTSNSWRRFAGVCEPIIQSDGHPDLHFPNGGPEGPDAMLLQDAPVLLAALREAAAELARLIAENERLEKELIPPNPASVVITRAREKIAELTAELRADAERLDWVAEHLFTNRWNGVIDAGSRREWHIVPEYRHVTLRMVGLTPSFRAALDAAMTKEAGNG